jgi:hypothetical protein
MPCIWGSHDKSQLFVSLAIIPPSALASTQGGSLTIAMSSIANFTALIDTGAQTTCITRAAAIRVGLLSTGKTPIAGVGGVTYHDTYIFHVGFPAGAQATAPRLDVFPQLIQGPELAMTGAPFDVLLGMDIIGMGSLAVEGSGTFSFSY